MTSNDFTNLSERPVDRRTLIKAGAWAAPAVVLAVAVPPASASVTAVQLTAVHDNGDFWNLTLVLTGAATGATLSTRSTGAGVTWVTSFTDPINSPGTYSGRVKAGGTSGQTSTIFVTVGGVESNGAIVTK